MKQEGGGACNLAGTIKNPQAWQGVGSLPHGANEKTHKKSPFCAVILIYSAQSLTAVCVFISN